MRVPLRLTTHGAAPRPASTDSPAPAPVGADETPEVRPPDIVGGVAAGETVGVILLGPGGPARLREAEGYVARLVSDPRRVPLALLPGPLRRTLGRALGRMRRPRLVRELRALGGQSPEAAHTADVAAALERTLNRRTFPAVVWQVTTAFRYGGRTLDDARADLAACGVDRVLVVPFAPPGLTAVAASLREAWTESGGDAGALVPLPPLADALADAVRERMCEAMQRFPPQARASVHVLYAIHPAARFDSGVPDAAPIAAVLRPLAADPDLPAAQHVAFGRTWGLALQAAPGVEDEMAALAAAGVRSLLVVPIGYLCDTLDIAYELDIAMRGRGLDLGMLHIEVAAAIGPHADLLDALAECLANALGVDTPTAAVPPAARRAA